MRKVSHKQGSPEWLGWRRGLLTATDCSVIMQCNPWTTPYKLWQRKLGLVEEQRENAAMNRGSVLEPEARAKFIADVGIEMKPMVVESDEYTFLGASLDGISTCGKYLLEVKCNGTKNHELARDGLIPDYYEAQMQHQLLVTGAEKCYYYSYDGKDGVCIEVKPDSEFLEIYLPKASDFWKKVVFFEAPSLMQSDYVEKHDSLEWQEYAKQYGEAEAQLKAMEVKKDYLRKKLIELASDQNCVGGGIKVLKTIVKGRVDYESIDILKNIDLNKYRKETSTVWRILTDK